MELKESTFLTSDYTTKLQSLKKYGTGTKTEIQTNRTGGQEATVRTRHGTYWFQIGKEHIKAVYCHPAYLTYMQCTS